jgi:4-hydroxy-tetrahydrodipicolinate synthase
MSAEQRKTRRLFASHPLSHHAEILGGTMKPGCYTALVTPFIHNGLEIDRPGLEKLVAFQVQNGISGILAVGTTGESPTLSWDEHDAVVEMTARLTRGHCLCIAGAGSNNTAEALSATRHALDQGVDAVLLVDPYYNGPSSLEIRKEYLAPIAREFPDLDIVPYIIPGRTGTQLLPEDLALLHAECPNVASVKEATANLANMRRTRECCGPDFTILSGDDGMTLEMMSDATIGAAGVISVLSNIAPRALTRMVALLRDGALSEAQAIQNALLPLFELVTVKTVEQTPYGDVLCRARNPLAVKTLMAVLGMPSGPCRRPLGKMTRNGLDSVLETARNVWHTTPEILQPVADFFGVNIGERLEDPRYQAAFFYDSY